MPDKDTEKEEEKNPLDKTLEAATAFGRGLTTDAAGAPVDIINLLLDLAGAPVEDKPVGGSKWIRERTGQPVEEEGAINVLSNLLSGLVNPSKAAAGTASALPLLAGVFGSRGAKNAPQEALDAAQMLKADKTMSPAEKEEYAQALFQDTGAFTRSTDDVPRFEIPDTDAKLKPLPREAGREGSLLDLPKYLDHPELFEQYPELGAMRVRTKPGREDNNSGLFQPGLGIEFNPFGSEAREVLLHEIQHAIQNLEKMPRGGSPVEFLAEGRMIEEMKKLHPQLRQISDSQIAHILYRQMAGEVEARQVEARSKLLQQFLSERMPWIADKELQGYQDVLPSRQIVKGQNELLR